MYGVLPRLLKAFTFLMLLFFLACIPLSLVNAAISPVVTERGFISLSLDGLGSTNATGEIIQVEKPAGATVRNAYLVAATVPNASAPIADGEVKIDGTNVTWSQMYVNNQTGQTFWNHLADVTSLVKPKIDAAPAGRVSFNIMEVNTWDVDGVIVAVIFDDPNQPASNTVILLFGGQALEGDVFTVDFAQPLNTSDPNLILDFSLGISYSWQGTVQYSVVDVNGTRLSTSAGGQDDGEAVDGALLTVGGMDDITTNPVDPYAPPSNSRTDDELYDLLPFVSPGDTSVVINTTNPSLDDNIFFAALFGASVYAQARDAFTLVSNVTTLDASEFIHLTGTLSPPQTGAITLYWTINASGPFHKVESMTDGVFERDFGFSTGPGTWQLYAYWPGDSSSDPATSNTITITVTPTSPSNASQIDASAWVPQPANAVAATIATAIGVGASSMAVAAAANSVSAPTGKVTKEIKALLPASVKKWLATYMASKRQLSVSEKTGSPFMPIKPEVLAYCVSIAVLAFSFSYVKVNTLAEILAVLPTIFATSILVGVVKTLALVAYARSRGVWTEHKLWYFGLAIFIVTTFAFKVPFSTPSRIVYYASKLSKRLGAILSSAAILISLAFAGLFYVLLIGGFTAIGSTGLAMCVISVFFDTWPIAPLKGKTILNHNKILWATLFTATLVLYGSWLLLL